MNILIAFLGLELLVVVHEAGHFFTARAVGMHPQRFYIGFPPALAKVRYRGIEYGIGAIPAGGFVSLPGMQRPAPSDLDVYLGPALREVPELTPAVQALRRALEAGDMVAAAGALPRLEHVVGEAELSPRANRVAQRGLRELRNGLTGAPYWRQAAWRRVAVSFAGPAVNLVLALALFTTLFIVGSGGYRLGFVLQAKGEKVLRTVDTVSLGYPASRIGLRPGDAIVAIDRKPVSAGGIHDAIASSNGRPLTLTVQRGAKRVTLGPARPRKDPQVSFATAVGRSLRLSGQMVRGTGVGLAHLVTGKNRHELAGPVGIVHISSEAASEGVRPYLFILGLVSLSLGVFNLLPFLPLDGGHILLSTIEGVRRRALGRAVYERFAAIGIALVLILAFIVLSNDIGGLGGG